MAGIGSSRPHIYRARAGLFDVDHLGHLNNAAYLTHAELARWEMTSHNGFLEAMVRNKYHFLVASTAVRYRREIRPLLRRFQIDSAVAGLDERSMWITHNFRYPVEGRNRVRAQMIVRGVAVKGRNVVDPRAFFRDVVGIDEEDVESITMTHQQSETTIGDMLERYAELEDAFREAAAADDETHQGL
jgi:acyl-CoA thioesterase FadM